jgi:hypothetical protein
MSARAVQLDTLLLPFVREMDEAESDHLLAGLVSAHADPIIRKVIKHKLRVSLNPSDGSHQNQDALEIDGDVRALLLAQLHALKIQPDSKAIVNFRNYVAGMSYHACSEYLRRKYPRRARLRSKLHYILTHNSAFALWPSADQQWLCGLAEQRAHHTETISAPQLQRLRDNPQTFSRETLNSVGGLEPTPTPSAIVAFFKQIEGPVELDELVNILGELYGIKDQTPYKESDREAGDDDPVERLPDTRVNVATEVEQRLYLQRLWGEVCQLPARQRAALLLNLRDTQGRGIIALFPLLRIASLRQIAEALAIDAEKFAALWNELPLEDAAIASLIGGTRQQVINLRMCARKRLANRMKGF